MVRGAKLKPPFILNVMVNVDKTDGYYNLWESRRQLASEFDAEMNWCDTRYRVIARISKTIFNYKLVKIFRRDS